MRDPDPDCSTCQGMGYIDETLGGHARANPEAPCPECVAPVPKYVPPKPRPCLCILLASIGIKCRAHSAGDGRG